MLSRDSEDEMWSRFVFELVIWPQEVTLVRWTQPSGPLCLWQCFFIGLDGEINSVFVCFSFVYFVENVYKKDSAIYAIYFGIWILRLHKSLRSIILSLEVQSHSGQAPYFQLSSGDPVQLITFRFHYFQQSLPFFAGSDLLQRRPETEVDCCTLYKSPLPGSAVT